MCVQLTGNVLAFECWWRNSKIGFIQIQICTVFRCHLFGLSPSCLSYFSKCTKTSVYSLWLTVYRTVHFASTHNVVKWFGAVCSAVVRLITSEVPNRTDNGMCSCVLLLKRQRRHYRMPTRRKRQNEILCTLPHHLWLPHRVAVVSSTD